MEKSSPSLKNLPKAPSGKLGWPWTEESPSFSFENLNDNSLPRISIITPSFNQGEFIEETIRSVLLQNYPNLEYIVIDGGSTDQTVEILKKYDPWLSYWVSERDRGQTDAINKGLEKVTGDLIAYLNSDDYYLPGAFQSLAETWQNSPQVDLFHGRCCYVNETGEKIGEQFASITQFTEIIDLWGVWWKKRQFVQPEVFWTQRITEKIGKFREDLYYVMDYDYWCRILQAGGKVQPIDREVTCFRFTDAQKSNESEAVAQELLAVVKPILWQETDLISRPLRLRLQGQWLFNVVWREVSDQSLAQGEFALIRWLKLGVLIIRYPQLLKSPFFQKKRQKWLAKLLDKLEIENE